MDDVARRARRAIYWGLLVSPGLLPLIVTYLPFQDWPGHLGVFGVLVHWDDAAFQLQDDYFFRGWVGPNRLFYVLGWPLGEWLGPLLGLRVTLALFLAGLAPAVHLFARALDVDPRVSVLVPPLALGRHLLCGFAPNAAALTTFVLALAAFARFRRRPRAGAWALMVGAGIATLGLHVFIFLALAGLIALSMVLDAFAKRGRAALGAGLALALFAPLTLAFGRPAASTSGAGMVSALLGALEAPTWAKAETAWTWLFASYHQSAVDDVIQAGWAAVALAMAALTIRALPADPRAPSRSDRPLLHAGAWCASSLAVFLAFGEYVGPPVNWWGASLRLPVITALFAVVLVAPGLAAAPARARAALLGAGGAVSAVFVVFVIATTLQFQRREMDGFRDVVDTIPRGATTCPLHEGSSATADFPGVAHGYVGNYVVARRGGVVPQGVFGNAGVMFGASRGVAQPGWGLKAGFSWPRHRRGCDYFLVRQPKDAAWYPEQQSRVLRLAASATWTLYAPTRAETP